MCMLETGTFDVDNLQFNFLKTKNVSKSETAMLKLGRVRNYSKRDSASL